MSPSDLAIAVQKKVGEARLVTEFYGISNIRPVVHLEMRTHRNDRWRRVGQIHSNNHDTTIIVSEPKADPGDLTIVRGILG